MCIIDIDWYIFEGGRVSRLCDVTLMWDAQQFPNQVVPEQQSLVVMKKLLAIAVSGITYLRGIFPDKAYGSKYLAG